MWPMYGTYIATLLGLAQINENHSLTGMMLVLCRYGGPGLCLNKPKFLPNSPYE
jgi:hypothetical protein